MKYTIELTNKQKAQMDCIIDIVHRYVGFNPKLEPIKATNVEDTNEHQIGYKIGFEDGENRQGYYDNGYNNALEDVNHALTVLENMTETEREEWFEDYASVGEVVRECTIQRIIKSTKEYKEKKKAEEVENYHILVDTLRTVTEEYPKETIVSALSEFGFEVDKMKGEE